MQQSMFSRVWMCRGTICIVAALAVPAIGQTTASSPLLTAAAKAFSDGQPITSVELAGEATWHAGGEVDSGPATLTANESGEANITLSLGSEGERTESQTAFGAGMSCQWTGEDGVAHQEDYLNCLRPVVWFLPSLSLQPSLVSSQVGLSDLGVMSVKGGSYHHLRAVASLSNLSGGFATSVAERSATDMEFDPGTLLPTELSYSVHPDDGAQNPVAIQIRYSDYQRVSGAMIPFSIQRYVNGSLQLDIQVTSAQVN